MLAMNAPARYWLVARVFSIAASAWGIATYPAERSNLDWTGMLLIPTVFSLCLWAWLRFRTNSNSDLAEPFSMTKPFLPMWRYPLHFWLVVSVSTMLGGTLEVLSEAMHGHTLVFGAMFILFGIAVLGVVVSSVVGKPEH